MAPKGLGAEPGPEVPSGSATAVAAMTSAAPVIVADGDNPMDIPDTPPPVPDMQPAKGQVPYSKNANTPQGILSGPEANEGSYGGSVGAKGGATPAYPDVPKAFRHGVLEAGALNAQSSDQPTAQPSQMGGATPTYPDGEVRLKLGRGARKSREEEMVRGEAS